MSHAEQTNDAAAAWIIRRENANWSDSDQAALDAWLAESEGNKAAFWRLEFSWQEADRIRSLGLSAGVDHPRSWFSQYWKPAAIAASLMLMVGLGTLQLGRFQPAPAVVTAKYDTPVGGRETVPLADGSRIELNTRTVIRTGVSKEKREVWLDNGEAFFEVAHDAAHPFVVHAGPKQITVLGTKFSVRREGDKVTVSVLEGRVRVDDAPTSPVESRNSATITRGVIAISQGGATLVTERSEERVDSALAWRDGKLSFDQTPLSEVAAEFNRYNSRPIVVTDPAAASIRIGGTFQASNVDAFLRLLHDAYGLKVDSDSKAVKISS
jgi:transmembrane sensor